MRKVQGLLEIPIVGTYKWPTRIFDSWGHVVDKRECRVSNLYAELLLASITTCIEKDMAVVLNYYADPSHVFENENYFNVLEQAKDLGVEFADYSQLIERVSLEMESEE